MGYKYQGRFKLGAELEHEIYDFASGPGIEVAGGFVGEEHIGIGRKCTRQGDSLLLAARELCRVVAKSLSQANPAKTFGRVLTRVGVAAKLSRQHHVLECGEAAKELECLKNKADMLLAKARAPILIECREFASRQPHLTLGRHIKTGENAQEGCLARSRLADNGAAFPPVDVQAQFIEYGKFAASDLNPFADLVGTNKSF